MARTKLLVGMALAPDFTVDYSWAPSDLNFDSVFSVWSGWWGSKCAPVLFDFWSEQVETSGQVGIDITVRNSGSVSCDQMVWTGCDSQNQQSFENTAVTALKSRVTSVGWPDLAATRFSSRIYFFAGDDEIPQVPIEGLIMLGHMQDGKPQLILLNGAFAGVFAPGFDCTLGTFDQLTQRGLALPRQLDMMRPSEYRDDGRTVTQSGTRKAPLMLPGPNENVVKLLPIYTGNFREMNSTTHSVPTTHENENAAIARYCDKLYTTLRKRWFPPKGSEARTVTLVVRIGSMGEIVEVRVKESSGVGLADMAARKAAEDARRFDSLPEGFDMIDFLCTFVYEPYQWQKLDRGIWEATRPTRTTKELTNQPAGSAGQRDVPPSPSRKIQKRPRKIRINRELSVLELSLCLRIKWDKIWELLAAKGTKCTRETMLDVRTARQLALDLGFELDDQGPDEHASGVPR